MKPSTVCSLFYGDHPVLAQRCLRSIEGGLREDGAKHVEELRFGLNAVSPRTEDFVRRWSADIHARYGIMVQMYQTRTNVFKYPLMRRMFHDYEINTDYVMWFDDDSYLESPMQNGWWDAMFDAIRDKDMIGQFWLMPLEGAQWEWVKSQPWYNEKVGEPRKRPGMTKKYLEFCQGAWWVIRNKVLVKYDWPLKDIRHNGGDSMLGELFRHQQLRMGRFHGGVRINADEQGRHSKAKPRHPHERKVGWNYTGSPLDKSFQKFACELTWVGKLVATETPIEIMDLPD